MNRQMFSYEGKATITIEYNGKKIKYSNHNEGTPQLFRLYAKALAGYNTFEDRPVYLDIRYTVDNSTYKSILTNDLPKLTAGNWYYDDFIDFTSEDSDITQEKDWITYYTGVIESSDIAGGKVSDLPEAQWRLCILDSGKKEMAFVDLGEISDNNLRLIQPGVKAVIEWTTCVRNVSTTSN